MPKVSPIQSNFNGGEFGPLTQGRVDSDRYKTGLALSENYLNTVQGPLIRRSGTKFVHAVKDSTKKTRLIPFEFSITQAYMLEFGDSYMRVYKNGGIIETSPGVPFELATTYPESVLFELKFAQDEDVLYITHPDYQPARIGRSSDTSWGFVLSDWTDGPYFPINSTSTTLVASAATGTVTVTASAISGINDGAGFQTADAVQLRHIRFQVSSTVCWGRITAVASPTVCTVAIVYGNAPTVATPDWRLGVWQAVAGGYPGTVVFHEGRLCYAGYGIAPGRVDMSNTGLYTNFSPTLADLSVVASNAIALTINSTDVNAIRWLTSSEKGLLAGTAAGEWVILPAATNEPLSPTNVSAKQATVYGSANVQPVQMGKATMFVQRSKKKIRELIYFFNVDGYYANDMTQIAEHITGDEVVQLSYQREPQPTMWCVRTDGVLAAMVYERNADALRAPWTRHLIGGVGHDDRRQYEFALVESVACIPSSDTSRNDVWLIVKRKINGAWVRYVEYITKNFEDSDDIKNAFFVDCGLTYDSPKTISGITNANPAVVTSTAHGFANSDVVIISDVAGMDTGSYDPDTGLPVSGLNGKTFTVANVTANTFELSGIDSTVFQSYISGGFVRKKVSTITGLDHLDGETVKILGDGSVQPDQVVNAGSVTLSTKAAVVQIGLKYISQAQMLLIDAGAADGTAMGKTRRTNRLGMLLRRTLGLMFGTDLFGKLDSIPFRDSNAVAGQPTPLFTGIKSLEFETDYDFYNQICWRQEDPVPGTILAIFPQMTTQDR